MRSRKEPLRILWADDQPEVIEALQGYLNMPRDIVSVGDADAALEALKEFMPDIIIVDLQMPPGQWGGLHLLRQMGQKLQDIPAVVVSGRGTLRECIEAQRLGARDYVEKEQAAAELEPIVERVVQSVEAERPLSDYATVRRLERSIHGTVLTILQRELERRCKPDIFRSLVPKAIALKTYDRMLDGNGTQDQYLDLLDFKEIIDSRWNEVAEFRLLEEIVKPRKKEERTRWIVDLNEVRKIVAHPVRGELAQQQRDTLQSVQQIVTAWQRKVHTAS